MTDSTVHPGGSGRLAPVFRSAAIGSLAGAVAGLATGLASRVAMRIFAEATQPMVSFTLEGTMVILGIAALFGLGTGIVYAGLRRVLPGPRVVKGILFGGLLILAILAPMLLSQPGEAAPDRMLGFWLFGMLCVAYGVALACLVALVDGRALVFDGVVALVGALSVAGGFLGLLLVGAAVVGLYAGIVADMIR